MNLRSLKTFLVVADQGNFARAANAVGLTQSAVSMQMRTLESQLGIDLFDRSKRPAVLSEKGEALVKRGRAIVNLADAILADSTTASELPGLVQLGAVRSTLAGILPRALTRISRQYPEVRISVVGGLPGDLIKQVAGGNLDAALVSEPQYLPSSLHWTPIMEEPLVVIASADASGQTDELLTSNPYIGLNRGQWGGRLIDEYLHSRGIILRPALEFDSLEPVILTVQRGLGVSIVHQGCIDHPLRLMLRRLLLCDPPLVRRLGLLRRPNGQRALIPDALVKEIETMTAENRDIWWPLRSGKPTGIAPGD